MMTTGLRIPTAILTSLLVGAALWGGPVAAQEAAPAGSGVGGNLAFTVVDAKSPFFLAGPAAIVASSPDAYVRRVSIAGDGDQHLLVVSLSDGDVLDAQAAVVRSIDRMAEAGGTTTLWGKVLKQTQPLTAEATPTVGFILGAYAGKDLLVRNELASAAAGALQRMDDVFLVAQMRGGADLLAMYAIDGADLASGVATANAIQDALATNEIEIEFEGVATPTSDEGP